MKIKLYKGLTDGGKELEPAKVWIACSVCDAPDGRRFLYPHLFTISWTLSHCKSKSAGIKRAHIICINMSESLEWLDAEAEARRCSG